MLPTLRLATLAVVALSARAAGASAASRLVYSRTDTTAQCPGESDLRAAVARRLGYDPFFPWAEQTISIELTEESGKLRARLKLIDRDGISRGERELVAPVEDCGELIASMAIAISITLDPMHAVAKEPTLDLVATPREPASSPAVEPPPVDAVTPVRRDATSEGAPREAAPRSTTVWSARAGPLVAVGAEPGVSAGGRAGIGVGRGHFGGFAEMRMDFPSSVASAAGGAAHSMLWGVALGPCLGKGFLSGCGVFFVGRFSAYATELARARSESMFYASAGVRLEGAFPLFSRVELVLHLDGLKTLTPATLELHEREAWRAPAFSAAAGAAASVRFP